MIFGKTKRGGGSEYYTYSLSSSYAFKFWFQISLEDILLLWQVRIGEAGLQLLGSLELGEFRVRRGLQLLGSLELGGGCSYWGV